MADAKGVPHRAVERGHERPLATIVGTVSVGRLAYRHRGKVNLYPADAALNLPEELYSHGLRELAAIEASRGSFEEAKEAIGRATGVVVGHRQVEELARAAAGDFEACPENHLKLQHRLGRARPGCGAEPHSGQSPEALRRLG